MKEAHVGQPVLVSAPPPTPPRRVQKQKSLWILENSDISCVSAKSTGPRRTALLDIALDIQAEIALEMLVLSALVGQFEV
jgi:hypothetical protein